MEDSPDSLRKVGLLVASLDRQTADQLLAQFPDATAEAIRSVIAGLSARDEPEQALVIRDFLDVEGRELGLIEAPRPGRQKMPAATPSRERSTAGSASPAALGDGEREPGNRPLERASERLIAECLCDELPQAIAVALAQLPAQRASEVVAHLRASLQAQVLERLVEFDPARSLDSPEFRDEFYQWLNEQIERALHRAELATRLATILDATHPGTRQLILHNVSSSDARLAKELQHQLAAIADS
jgi:flagellar motor switch protein FliG